MLIPRAHNQSLCFYCLSVFPSFKSSWGYANMESMVENLRSMGLKTRHKGDGSWWSVPVIYSIGDGIRVNLSLQRRSYLMLFPQCFV